MATTGRGSLTTAAIVDAAFTVLDAAGIDGLTLRAVADRLGVKAPAIYWHVRDKQAMLDEMGTRVWRSIAGASRWTLADDWRAALGAYARAARRALLAHRDGARVFSGTFLTDPEVLRSQEAGLAWMQDQGFSVAATTDAVSALTSFVIGHCIEEQARAQAPDDRYSIAVRDERVDAAEHPRVAASGKIMTEGDAWFERMLDMVLNGIATRRTPIA
jgi:AcrR family transcriptional regulator